MSHIRDHFSLTFIVVDIAHKAVLPWTCFLPGEEGQMRKLRQMMLSYVRMERDINIFMTAAEDVIKQVEGWSDSV